MKVIIFDEKHGATRAIVLKGWMRIALGLCVLGLPVLLGYYGYQLADTRGTRIDKDEATLAWAQSLREQKEELERVKLETLTQLESLTIRMANLQARLIRLDALGERLTNATGLDDGEFDFSAEPSVGGPEMPVSEEAMPIPDFLQELDELTRQIESRQQQLNLLNSIIIERDNDSAFVVAGRPVNKGYVSSNFGRRIDPFNGKMAWHQGLDFATGSTGEKVLAVAAGVVTFAGQRQGYGKVVQINHGNGYETLYAHDESLKVKVGDVVKKGQVVALSGNSGRSTGPHLHFEVHKNGRVVDPAAYIHSTSR